MMTNYYQKTVTAIFFLFFILFSFIPIASGDTPMTPAGLSVISGNHEASFTWEPVAGATEYVVWRTDTNGGPYDFVAQTQVNGYADHTINNGDTYYYVVTALNADGQSPYSSQVEVTPTASVLKAPTDVTVISGNGAVSLTWDAVVSAVHYNVYRISPGGQYTLLSPSAPGLSYTDRDVTNGLRYYYVIQTMSTSAGAYSDIVTAMPSTALPLAPETLTVSPGSTWASLSWTESEGATKYVVYQATNIGGPYDFRAILSHTTYEDSGLENGTTYYYVIAAMNENGYSAFSPEANALVSALEKPHAPVLIGWPDNESVTLNRDIAFGATSYSLKRSETSGGPYENIGNFTTSSYTDRALSNGTTYYYVVDAHNASSTIVSSNQVSLTPTESLPVPTNEAVTPGNTQATLTWNPVMGAKKYYVQVADSPGGSAIQSIISSKPSTTVSGLTNGQIYYFRVRTTDLLDSDYSDEVNTTPSAALPLAPISLIRTIGNTQGTLRWNAVEGAVGYKVFRRTESSAQSSALVGTTTGTIFNDTGLTNGIKYYYIVAAVNETGTGAWASSEQDITPTENYTLAPTNVAVIPGNTQATITWDPMVGVSSYRFQVAESSGGPYIISESWINEPNFTATGLTNGRTYYFRVQAMFNSAFSAEVTTTPSVALPLAPASLTRTIGNTQGTLTWDAVDGAVSYKIFRRTESSAWSSAPVGTTTGSIFTDTGLTNGIKYYYIVAAVNETGTGAWSTSDTYITPTENYNHAPTNVAIIPGNTQATITWNPVAGATTYYVQVAESSGGPSITTGTINKPSYTATGLTNGRAYYFRVRTQSPKDSAYSEEVSTIPSVALPLAPTSLHRYIGNTQGTLIWNAVDGAVSYKIFRRTELSAWSSAPVGTSTGTIFTDTGLINGIEYYYIVSAVNGTGTGAWASSEVALTPNENAPLMPTNVAISPGDTQATLTWEAVAGATRYKIIHAASLDGPYNLTVWSSSTTYIATGLSNGQAYYCWVQADNGSLSAYSEGVVTTPDWPLNTGNMSGHVSVNIAGYNDLGIQNATASLQGTAFSANTDANGDFIFVNVPFGDYQLVVAAPGMDTITQDVSFAVQDLQLTIPQMTITCLPGDANGDDLVGLEDAIYILQIVTGVRQ